MLLKAKESSDVYDDTNQFRECDQSMSVIKLRIIDHPGHVCQLELGLGAEPGRYLEDISSQPPTETREERDNPIESRGL